MFLTQSHPKQTQGSDIWAGTSLDQMYAQHFGQDTPMPSMQFCIENLDQAGGCTYNYSCAYTDSISWASPNEPLPMIRDPRVAFDMLFGAGGTPKDRAARRQTRRSILDWICGEVARRAQGSSASATGTRLDRYLDNVREIERRIQAIEARNSSGESARLPDAPAGVPDSFSEHMRLMFDLQVLALADRHDARHLVQDRPRRAEPRLPGERRRTSRSTRLAPRQPRGPDPGVQQDLQVPRRPAGVLPRQAEDTTDGDSNLLDKTLIVWGSPMADPNVHNHRRCPLVLFGHANGMLKGNLHLKAADGTPMANVMLTLLHELGLDDIKSVRRQHGRVLAVGACSKTVA